MGEVADRLDGCAAIQRDLDSLKKRGKQEPHEVEEHKCKVLHLERNNSRHKCTLGTNWQESSFPRKNLQVLVKKNTQP